MLNAVFRGRGGRPLPLRPQEWQSDAFEEFPKGDAGVRGIGIAEVRFRYQLIPLFFRLRFAHLGMDTQSRVLSGVPIAIEQDPHLAPAVFSYLQTAFLM